MRGFDCGMDIEGILGRRRGKRGIYRHRFRRRRRIGLLWVRRRA